MDVPLHDGEITIGSDKGNDIFLYLNEKEDIADEVNQIKYYIN